MNEMIERVARAMEIEPPLTESEERSVREVIAAMREPTEAMLEIETCTPLDGDLNLTIWRAMIDEALK